MTPTLHRGNRSQVKRNPHLWVIYLSLLLPAAAGSMSVLLAINAFHSPGFNDRIIKLVLAIAAAAMSVKCWAVTWGFSRDMRQFLETLQAIKRGEFILRSGRAGLPEIESLPANSAG